MARKLEASGHIRRKPAPGDARATLIELTASGKTLAERVKEVWCSLADETVAGLSDEVVAELPRVLGALIDNVGASRPSAHTAH